MNFSYIKQIRKEKGLTAGELCAGAGLSAPTLTKIERGGMPTLTLLDKLGKFLGVGAPVLVAAACEPSDCVTREEYEALQRIGRAAIDTILARELYEEI